MRKELKLFNEIVTLLVLMLAGLHLVNYFFPQEYSGLFTTWWVLASSVVLLTVVLAATVSQLKGKSITFRQLPKLVLLAGRIIILVGMISSSLWRFDGIALMDVGLAFSGNVGEYQWVNTGILTKPANKPFTIGVQDITIKGSGFVSTIVLLDEKGKVLQEKKLTKNSPGILAGYNLYMQNAGYLPAIMVYKQGESLYNDYIRTAREEQGEYGGAFNIPAENWKATVQLRTLAPTAPENKGLETPVSSMLNLTIADGDKKVFDAPVLYGSIAKKGDVVVEYNDVRTWAQLRIVKDSGIRLIFVGTICVLVGLVLRRLR